jgi:hypothetical protein
MEQCLRGGLCACCARAEENYERDYQHGQGVSAKSFHIFCKVPVCLSESSKSYKYTKKPRVFM